MVPSFIFMTATMAFAGGGPPSEKTDPLEHLQVIRAIVKTVEYDGSKHSATTTLDVLEVLRGDCEESTLVADTGADMLRWQIKGITPLIPFSPAVEGEEVIFSFHQYPDWPETQPGHSRYVQRVNNGHFYRKVEVPDGRSFAANEFFMTMSATPTFEGVTDFTGYKLLQTRCEKKRVCFFGKSDATGWWVQIPLQALVCDQSHATFLAAL